MLNSASFHFRLVCYMSSFLAIVLLVGNFYYGKIDFFLLLNYDGGAVADYFFKTITYIGDGLIWIPLLIYICIKHPSFFTASIVALITSTLITHFFKQIILPDEPRPIEVIKNISLIHIVPEVDIHHIKSFPSGHTATAFTIMLLLACILKNTWLVYFLFLLACFAGYSRIYLAQHFPLDFAGGIITALVSVAISIKLKNLLKNKIS